MFRHIVILGLLAIAFVSADKDDQYYRNGIVNPNVYSKNSMFWSEGYNVLQDLENFDNLYVKFHSCAWSEYYSDFENAGDGDGDDWYLSSVPSFRANVAFSLYGVLKGHRNRKCSKSTFINSFYTTGGIESFTNALAYAGVSGFTIVDEEGGEENNNSGSPTSMCDGDEDRRRTEDHGYYNGAKMSYGSYSTGVGCAGSKFVSLQFGGGYCDGSDVLAVLDPLESFNEQLESTECVQIYSSGDYFSNDDEESASPLTLLQTSQSCSTKDLVGKCPDPYHKLAHYEANLECAIYEDECEKNRAYTLHFRMFFAGGVMIFASAVTFFVVNLAGKSQAVDDDGTRSRKSKKKKDKKDKKKKKKRKEKMINNKAKKASKTPNLSPVVSEGTGESEDPTTSFPAWADPSFPGSRQTDKSRGSTEYVPPPTSKEPVADSTGDTGGGHTSAMTSGEGYTSEEGYEGYTSGEGYGSGGGYTSGEGDSEYDTENENKKNNRKAKKKRGFFSRFRRNKKRQQTT